MIDEIKRDLKVALDKAAQVKELLPYSTEPVVINNLTDDSRYGDYWTNFPLLVAERTCRAIDTVTQILASSMLPSPKYKVRTLSGFIIFDVKESENKNV